MIFKTLKLLCILFLFFFFSPIVYAQDLLSQFVQEVLDTNPAIQAAQSNVVAAKARKRAAGYPIYNPTLSAQQQYALENQTYLQVDQTIDWVNKRGANEQVSSGNLATAEAELADLRQKLIAEILTSLSQYQAQQQIVSLAKDRTSVLQQFVTLTKKRYKNGDIARVDLDLAELALSEALAQQATAEVNENQALQILRAITGRNQINWPRLLSRLPNPVTNFDTNNLIMRLPKFSVSNRQYQTAISKIKVAERQRYPDPTIGIQGGRSSDDTQHKGLIGLTFSIPLFVLNPYRAEVDAANFDAMEAEGKRGNIYRLARAEIQGSAERYKTLFVAIKQWQDTSGKPLSDGLVLVERLWQAGEISTTDYLVSVKQRIDSQIAGVELKGRAQVAWVEWLKSSGQIENWLHVHAPTIGDCA